MIDPEVEDFLRCDVCKDSFYDPVTLLCQHSFCSYCVSSIKECPMCRLKIYLPKQRNNLFTQAIKILYGPEKMEELHNKFHLTKLEKEIRPQVEKELKNDLDKMLIDNTKVLSKKTSESDYKNINISASISSISKESEEITQLPFFSIDNFIKWIEMGFLAYYLYSFIISVTNYGFSWIKFFLNLFVLIQAAIPMIGSNYLNFTSNPINSVLDNLL